MTDDRDSSSDGTAESRNAEYDEIAQRIIDYRSAAGLRPGIYGANRCQLCGEITTFSSLIGAGAAHFGPHRDRACTACVKHYGRSNVGAAIQAQTLRRCEVCGLAVERWSANRLGSYWVCGPCRSELGPGDPRFGSADGLNQLVRRRYMALAYPTVEELLQFEQTVLAIRADLNAADSRSARSGEPAEGGGSPVSLTIVGSPPSGRLR
jgi:hypothetical protein